MWLWSFAWSVVWIDQMIQALPSEQRSSDPHIQGEGINPESFNPSHFDLPMGSPDTMETDIPGAPLSPNDFENSEVMYHSVYAVHESIDISHQADPIELAGLFQGDIMLNPEDQLEELAKWNTTRRGRSAMVDVHRRWPNGVIPYVISQTYDENERATIAKAMSEYHNKTCLRFVPRTIEKDYIHILKGDGCSSSVGRVSGAQPVSLGPGCLYVGIVLHEFMHAAGFWHEQSRYDRDNFITINKLNVKKDMWFNFEKYNWDKIQTLGVPYDLESVMHYGPYAFAAKELQPTIIPRETGVEIGQRRGFSKRDIEKLQKLYNCADTSVEFASTSTSMPLLEPSTEECIDNNEKYCQPWADRGECENNPTWMNVNCRKACRQCGGAAGKECQDHNVHCATWMEAGECTQNPDYMALFCKKSCGICRDHEQGKECQDHDIHCATWMEAGECTRNPAYMSLFCKKSCEICRDHEMDLPIQRKCEDKNKFCDAWSTMGQCRTNPKYMIVYCRKSCKAC
ncbi:zinc metalloproteinase nas-4-like isoform X2 [Palaemon carinicauda]|uniref:zinc metalloproteinase nas-4-like isoform X2 n=1 Tax=Palaemon carinicauda TaxID=392227 RepID=UPI0035B628D1